MGPTFRALLVGADFYFPNRTSAGEFLSLSGCVHDVGSVEAMLRARVTLPLSIRKLTSTSVPGNTAPVEPEAERPTYANIRAELERLAAEAQEGDVVLVHYAGHGARIKTRFEDLKGPGGFDEALVPIDIANKATRYIRDLDLAFILQQLVAKKTILTVVLDSCHSGGATRGGDVQRRGATVWPRCATGRPRPGAVDTTERPAEGFAPDGALRAAYKALRATGTRDGRTGKTWLPSSKGYVLLAACLETQAALEVSVDGRPRMGVLTGAWLDTLRDLGTDLSWKTVFERTRQRMEDAGFHDQTPVLLGDEHRKVFGPDLRETAHTFEVVEVDRENARVRVDGGTGMGLGPGAELEIHALGTMDLSSGTGLLAVAKVSEAAATSLWATVDVELAGKITTGALAVVRGLAVPSTVALVPRAELPPAMARTVEEAALSAARSALGQLGRGFVAEAGPGETPTFRVQLDEQARYVVASLGGAPLSGLPALASAGEGAAAELASLLVHLARYEAVARISSPPSSLDTEVEMTFRDADGTVLSPDERGRYALAEGSFRVHIVNGSSADLYVGILDLQSNWEIVSLAPPDDGTRPFEHIAARGDDEYEVDFFVPDGASSAVDRVKVMMMTSPVDYRRLTLPPPGARRDVPRKLAPDASSMDRLVDAPGRGARDAPRSALTDSRWCVRELWLDIRKAD